MSGKWDGRERDMEDHNRRVRDRDRRIEDLEDELDDGPPSINSDANNNNSGSGGGGSKNNGWSPRHHDPPTSDPEKIYSVSEASRLHKNPIGEDKKPHSIIVRGVISGIQPMRKMIKGLTKTCMQCNTVFVKPYNKPEFYESFVPVEHIYKCTACNTKDYLGAPEYDNINAVIVELKDCDTFSEIDPLRIIVFGDDEPVYDSTRDIDKHIGETIEVTGDIFTIDISRRRGETKMVAYLYVSSLVKYLSKQDLELTAEDVKAIKRFVAKIGPDNIIEKLSDMFATSIIGYNIVKKGLLLSAVSSTTDKTMKKIHCILVGDPGLAKSLFLREATKLVPNSRYESVQFATGRSLTAIITKEEGDALILRAGPIPQAKGAIAALNEIGRMNHDDQGLMLDTMQEQEFTTNKFGQNFHIDAPTTIIASANPTGGSWKSGYDDSSDDRIDLDKIPMIKPLMDRFDLPFVFKDSKDESSLIEYAYRKSEMEDHSAPDYTTYLAKHIMYAKQKYPRPIFSEEAKAMLNQYYVKIRMTNYGSPRIRDTIYKIAQNITRLKLKNIVDAADANETMQFYNIILQQLNMIVSLPSNPRDIVYNECLNVLMDSALPISFEELIDTVCKDNQHISRYLGLKNKNKNKNKLRNNIKLRSILDMLQNHSRVKIVNIKPVVLQYMRSSDKEKDAAFDNTKPDNSKEKGGNAALSTIGPGFGTLCDPCDVCDGQTDTLVQNSGPQNNPENCTQGSQAGSHISHTSHSNLSENGNGHLLRCYYCEKKGSIFETDIELEYFKHGDQQHLNKPMYPNMATIEKYGLKTQGILNGLIFYL
jgi:DNA replicative helicase MCM subunit Mcm2 (Cdc46/Mcm family)